MPATVTRARVHTWADGFGRWYASVPAGVANPKRTAREAIKRELGARGELRKGYRVRVESAPEHWQEQWQRPDAPAVYREV